ncbi:hypothetical protein CEXT_202561 [Caerostris extrusa]|uniref:Uncharacterized protein n=1 Tax=Caerostris extrusa TaxID=172846 RepID=A0AAV4RVT5_CAEEX|nr:hypothetical protein CEXT_202561 [Caerostris extrusa]
MFSAETRKEIITNDKKLGTDNIGEISYGASVPVPEMERTFINDKMHYFDPRDSACAVDKISSDRKLSL